MRLLSALAVGLAVLAAPAAADDAAKELTGSFKRKAGDIDLKMTFKKDGVLVTEVGIGEVGCTMESKYKKEKDGTYKCEVTKFEKKGDFPVTKEKGWEYSFKFTVKDKKGTLSDFMGADVDDNARMSIEGDYDVVTD